MSYFAKDADLVESLGRIRLLIRDEGQRFLDGHWIALAHAKDQRRLAGSRHGLEEFVGQAGEFASAVGILEALHEMHTVSGRRGETQELSADEQIGPAAFRGEATHQARQKMLLDERAIPDGRILGEAHDGLAIEGHVGFQREPEQQRDIGVRGVLIAGSEGRDEFEHLVGRQTTCRRGELRTHFGVGFGLRPGEDRGKHLGGKFTGALGFETGDAEAAIDAIFIAEETRGPEADRSVGMGQRGDSPGVGERIGLIEGPKRTEGSPALVGCELRVQQGDGLRVAAFGQELQRGRAVELIRVTK